MQYGIDIELAYLEMNNKASSTKEAIGWLKERHVDLVVAGAELKEQSSITFLMEVKRIREKLHVIVITDDPVLTYNL